MSRNEPFGFSPGAYRSRTWPRGLEPVELVVGRVEAAGRVLDRDRETLSFVTRAREGAVVVDDLQSDLAADEPQRDIRQQRTREQTGLAQDLKAVADPQDQATVAGELRDLLHHRREPGDRAGAQVVPVREPPGDDDRIDAVQVAVRVPQQDGLSRPRGGLHRVDLVARPGEADHAELHEGASMIS